MVLIGFPAEYQGVEHETDVPAEQPTPQEGPRLPGANEHPRRTPGPEPAPGQGTQEALGLGSVAGGLRPSPWRGARPATEDSSMGLPRSHRLTRREDFQRLYEGGRKYVHRLAVFYALPSESQRVGLTVSKRIGNAVQRNRVKRRLREALRRRLSEIPRIEMVVVARSGLAAAPFSACESAVTSFLCWLRPTTS